MSKHPIQPIENVDGVLCFKKNAIVDYLWTQAMKRGYGASDRGFSVDDQRQFAQLIGYNLKGYRELNCVDDDSYCDALEVSKGKDEKDAKIERLEAELRDLRTKLREPMARFWVHPDDLARNVKV